MSTTTNRVYLYTRTPPDLVMRNWIAVVVFSGPVIASFFLTLPKGNTYFEIYSFYILGVLFAAFLMYFQSYMNKGYRVSYDDEAVYLRPDGVTWRLGYRAETAMRYDDISEIVPEYGHADMRPFEFVNFWRKDWDGKEQFFVSRMYLKDSELREFFRFLYTKCPDKFPEGLVEYMNTPDQPY
jgi:hypothetical protein